MGMASTRNTGFARYAAISALVALPGLMSRGKLAVRIIWGIVFTASLYALIIANGRTETVAFVGGVAVILGAEKAKRFVNFLVGVAAAILLGLRGFFSAFYLYFTRTGQIDPTMTGRTVTWEEGLRFSCEVALGGFRLPGRPVLSAGAHAQCFPARLLSVRALGRRGDSYWIDDRVVLYDPVLFSHPPADKSLIPPEIPAVFLFVTISSIAESTFAYFSAAWLLSAPIVAYVMALHRHIRRISVKAAQERALRVRLARRDRFLGPLRRK